MFNTGVLYYIAIYSQPLNKNEKHIPHSSIPSTLSKKTNIASKQIPSYQEGKLKIYLGVMDTF